MRHTIGLLSIAAVMFFALAQLAPAQSSPAAGTVITPDSSIERLEDIGVRAHTNILLFIPDKMEFNENGAPIAENPLSLACIYKLVKQTKGCPKTSKVVPTGGSNAVALIDAYDNPDAATDITTFASAYGYGTPNFTKVKVGNPGANSGWALEESLDIEYAFGMAPNAHIYLVEANSNSSGDLYAAEDKATSLLQTAGGGEASNSWQGGEYGGETSDDSHFKGKGVVYFASSGDSGGRVGYPSTSPFVVSAGGTTINRDSNGNFTGESAWSSAGGGPSQYEKRPTYQNIVKKIVGSKRGTPDFSSEAATASAVAIYSQYGCGGWCEVGGTSVSSPTLAGIVNAAGAFQTSTTAELTAVYKEYGNKTQYKSWWRDITTGSNGYACGKGYEMCTGVGSPITYKGK